MRKFTVILLLFSVLLISSEHKSPALLHEASYYTKLDKQTIRCDLCPNYCVLKDGQKGICRTRKNISGKMYSLVYNQPVAIHIDPIEKKPLYHFYPGTRILSLATAGCNMNCNFCQNWTISQTDPEIIEPYHFLPEEIIDLALREKCESIAFTYTEPTVFFEYMLAIAKLAQSAGINTVLVSCGYINPEPLNELLPYLSAANIDLKGFSEEFYGTYTTGRLSPVLTTLEIIAASDVHLEITNLVIPGANDTPQEIEKMCNWVMENLGMNIPFHFSRFFPHYKLTGLPPTSQTTLVNAREIALQSGMRFVYIGNLPDTAEDTYCPECNQKIIDRYGYLIKSNHIMNGCCEFCGARIEGRFEP